MERRGEETEVFRLLSHPPPPFPSVLYYQYINQYISSPCSTTRKALDMIMSHACESTHHCKMCLKASLPFLFSVFSSYQIFFHFQINKPGSCFLLCVDHPNPRRFLPTLDGIVAIEGKKGSSCWRGIHSGCLPKLRGQLRGQMRSVSGPGSIF